MSKDCVHEYVKKAHGRIQVFQIIHNCKISMGEAVTILEELKSKGYLGGNPKDGYWLTREGWQQIKT